MRGALLAKGTIKNRKDVDDKVQAFWRDYFANMSRLVANAQNQIAVKFKNSIDVRLENCAETIANEPQNIVNSIRNLAEQAQKPDPFGGFDLNGINTPDGMAAFLKTAKAFVADENWTNSSSNLTMPRVEIELLLDSLQDALEMRPILASLADPKANPLEVGSEAYKQAEKIRAEINQSLRDGVLNMTAEECRRFQAEIEKAMNGKSSVSAEQNFWSYFGNADANMEAKNVQRVLEGVQTLHSAA